MGKHLKTAIIILVFGVTGFIVYYLYKKFKGSAKSSADLKVDILPAIGPPKNGTNTPSTGLYSVDNGEGAAAILIRVNELNKAGAAEQVKSESGFGLLLIKGLTAANYYNDTLTKHFGGNTNGMPVVASGPAFTALTNAKALSYSDGIDGWANIEKIKRAVEKMSEAGLPSPIENDAIQDSNKFRDNFICGENRYLDCPSNRKKVDLSKGVRPAITDLSKYASNYIAASKLMTEKIREIAIQDLRESGWKFIGYDKPNA